MEKFRIGGLAESCFLLAGILIVVIVFLLLTSCKQIEYVTVEKVRNDTTYITKHQRDSVWLHDSIMVSEKGDTIRIEKWHTKYIEKVSHDTTYVATHDTIPQPYPVTEYVEKPLGWWQKGLIWIGIIALMVVIVTVVWKMKRFLPIR